MQEILQLIEISDETVVRPRFEPVPLPLDRM
jgi:hypothetical protein